MGHIKSTKEKKPSPGFEPTEDQCHAPGAIPLANLALLLRSFQVFMNTQALMFILEDKEIPAYHWAIGTKREKERSAGKVRFSE